MERHIAPALLALALATVSASAQTANSSPASGFGRTGGNGPAGGNVSRTAPSGGTAKPGAGTPQIGAETPVEKKADEQSRKDTTICNGC